MTSEDVQKLQSELWSARDNLIGLMPHDLRELLNSYISLKESDKIYPWLTAIADKVLAHAKPRPPAEMNDTSSHSDRAFCPLCAASSLGFYGELGFAFPDGLRRHLLGEHNARECVVMEAARHLAIDHVRCGRDMGHF